MHSIRIVVVPDCKMVSSMVGMFGDPAFDAFIPWLDSQPRSIYPKDYLMCDQKGFRWLYLYEEGMDVPEPFSVIDFKGGLYAVATDIDQQTDKQAMDAEVEAFLVQNGLMRDADRPELGNIITPPEAKAILGYEQMDYYYPIKGR
ncbi:MAG: AraC family transcriptional regulator [Clostridia bacterium]|nr:AraC family transcriptional regulator [Clostridia bacterium]